MGVIAAAVVGEAAACVAAAIAPWSYRHSWPGWGPPLSAAAPAAATAARHLQNVIGISKNPLIPSKLLHSHDEGYQVQ